jgi:hypothetical protein
VGTHTEGAIEKSSELQVCIGGRGVNRRLAAKGFSLLSFLLPPACGYAVNLPLDDDGDYLAHLAELPNVSALGSTAEKALVAGGCHRPGLIFL